MNLFNRLLIKLKNNSFWGSIVILSSGQVIGQAIAVITTPIISRIYSNQDYGDQGVVVSITALLIGFVGLGMNSAIMVAPNSEDAKRTVVASIVLQSLMITLLVMGLVVLSPMYQLFSVPVPYTLSYIIVWGYGILQIVQQAMQVYVNRLHLNKVLFYNPFINAGTILIVTIPLGIVGMSFTGLMVGLIISSAATCAHMIKKANPFTHYFRFHDIRWLLSKYKELVFYQYPANLMSTTASQIPNQAFSKSFGNVQLGNYAMCIKLFSLPLHLIAAPIQNVYFRTAVEKKNDLSALSKMTFSLVTKVCMIAFIPVAILIIWGGDIFAFTLGSNWYEAGRLASILSLQYVFAFCNNCVIYCRVSIGKQKFNLVSSIIQIVMIASSLWIGISMFGNMYEAVLVYSLMSVAWNIINITITFFCLKEYAIRWLIFSVLYSSVCIALYPFMTK